MSKVRRRPFTSAHAIALLALFISLGGTSYAVTKLPKNSVGSSQVKDHSLKASDLAKGVLASGPQGPAGARGPRGAEGQAAPKTPIVSKLPTSPSSGDEIYLEVDTAGAYGGPYLWHARYDAALPFAKWWVLGARKLVRSSGGGFAPSTTTWTHAGAPRVTPPVPGIYQWEARVAAQSGGGAGGQFLSWITSPSTPAAGIGYSFVSADGGYDRIWNLIGPVNERHTAPAERTISYAVSGAGQEFEPTLMHLMASPIRLGE